MAEYDITLNGVGYHLMKDTRGALVSGACVEQVTNPFARSISSDKQYKVVPFRFTDGAGLAFYDGSNRYQEGRWIDSRGGHIIAAPDYIETAVGYGLQFPVCENTTVATRALTTDGNEETGYAMRFAVPTGCTSVKAVHVLVRRPPSTTYNFDIAANARVAIYSDTTGPKPNAEIQGVDVSLKADTGDGFYPFRDRWLNKDWFWLECRFATAATVTPASYYWLVILNDQDEEVDCAQDTNSYHATSATISTKYLGAWSDGSSHYPLIAMFHYGHEQDQIARAFAEFRGTDTINRMYMACGHKVMYFRDSGAGGVSGTWANSKELTDTVLGLIEFKSKLWAYQGPNNDCWYSNGASGSTTWTQATGIQANAMAIHDNLLWRCDISTIVATQDGSTWASTTNTVGDEDTPVLAMVSHGGKLFCAKADGIYEVTYPDGYPGSGKPVANLMMDFSTEKSARPWMLDWHSGLYFPGVGGFYEFKNNLLRNAWAEKIDEGAQEINPRAGPMQGGTDPYLPAYTKPRSWSPIYDARPGMFTAVHGTTRGIWALYSDPHLYRNNLWFFDGRGWHDFGPLPGTKDPPGHYGEPAMAIYYQDQGGGRGRLWASTGIDTYRMEHVPSWTMDRLVDSDADYCWEAPAQQTFFKEIIPDVTTPVYGAASAADSLLFAKVGVTSRYCDASDLKMWIYYRKDDATNWTMLSTPVTTSPYQEIDFPSNVTGRRIQFKVELRNYTSDPVDDTITPVLEQLELLYQPLPESMTTHQVIIDCSPNHTLQTGGQDQRATSTMVAALEALPDSSSFTYVTPAGLSKTVRATGTRIQYTQQDVDPGSPRPLRAYAVVNMIEVL